MVGCGGDDGDRRAAGVGVGSSAEFARVRNENDGAGVTGGGGEVGGVGVRGGGGGGGAAVVGGVVGGTGVRVDDTGQRGRWEAGTAKMLQKRNLALS